jgi:hypothetical protein
VVAKPPALLDTHTNTLRNKYDYPAKLRQLMEMLESEKFMSELSQFVGHKLYKDPNRNFWDVHKYDEGDKLDINVDPDFTGIINKKTGYSGYIFESQLGKRVRMWIGDMGR